MRVPARELVRIFVLGVLGVAASNYFYYVAIQKTNVATAIVLQYTAPVWVLLYMALRGLHRATLQRIAAVALAMFGIALLIGLFRPGGLRLNAIGVIAGMLAAFSFAFYNVAGHSILVRRDHWIVLLYTTLGASLFWIAINPPWKIIAARYSGGQWAFLAMFSLISVLAPFAFYFAGLRHLEPTRAIVVSCLEPVFSIALAAVLLGETLRTLQTVGIVLVLVAVVVVQMPDANTGEAIPSVQPGE